MPVPVFSLDAPVSSTGQAYQVRHDSNVFVIPANPGSGSRAGPGEVENQGHFTGQAPGIQRNNGSTLLITHHSDRQSAFSSSYSTISLVLAADS